MAKHPGTDQDCLVPATWHPPLNRRSEAWLASALTPPVPVAIAHTLLALLSVACAKPQFPQTCPSRVTRQTTSSVSAFGVCSATQCCSHTVLSSHHAAAADCALQASGRCHRGCKNGATTFWQPHRAKTWRNVRGQERLYQIAAAFVGMACVHGCCDTPRARSCALDDSLWVLIQGMACVIYERCGILRYVYSQLTHTLACKDAVFFFACLSLRAARSHA